MTGAWVFSSGAAWEPARDPLHWLWESTAAVSRRLLRAGLAQDHPYHRLDDDEVARTERAQRTAGAGLGLEFAAARIEQTGRAVGLIPSAHGATSLDEWWPDASRAPGDSLYSAMIARTRAASAASGAVVEGLLWYQGESDSTPELSAVYEDRLCEWIERVRADLGREDLPVLIVQLGRVLSIPAILESGLDPQSWTRIREAHRRIGERIPQVRVTSAVDLDLCDEIHIDTPGLRRLGRRLARLAAGELSPALASLTVDTPSSNGRPTVVARFDGVEGGWNDHARITGFVATDAHGTPTIGQQIISAQRIDESGGIRFVLSELTPGLCIAYAPGFDPPAFLRDQRDLPLLAFGPEPISG